jgi:uncharacterized membrane protein
VGKKTRCLTREIRIHTVVKMAFLFLFFFFFLLNHPFQNAYPMNYGTKYVFFMCARACVRAHVCVSQVTPILNGFVPEVIFTASTGKMIREKFGRTYT